MVYIDGWEITYELNETTDDSALGLDGDTFNNFTGYQSGTNPKDDTSHP